MLLLLPVNVWLNLVLSSVGLCTVHCEWCCLWPLSCMWWCCTLWKLLCEKLILIHWCLHPSAKLNLVLAVVCNERISQQAASGCIAFLNQLTVTIFCRHDNESYIVNRNAEEDERDVDVVSERLVPKIPLCVFANALQAQLNSASSGWMLYCVLAVTSPQP